MHYAFNQIEEKITNRQSIFYQGRKKHEKIHYNIEPYAK